MRRRVLALVRKEFRQIGRDPHLLPILLIFPVLQLLLLGYAVSTDIRHVGLMIVDQDRTPASRELAAGFSSSGYFDIVGHASDERAAGAALDRGTARLVLVVPPGFGGRLARGERPAVQVIADGVDANTANVALAYAGQIIRAFGATSASTTASHGLDLRLRVWFNPDLKSVNYMIPGLLASILSSVTITIMAGALVKEKERGTIEQLVVTPLRAVELMAGKILPFVVIGYANILIVLVVGVLWFRVPVAGSVPLLLALSGLFMLGTLGLGLLISTTSETIQQAMMLSLFLNPPMYLLSGFIFPIASMPEAMQWLTYAIPLRYYLVILRGIFLKGVGLEVLWREAGALALFGVAVLTLSVLRFRRTLG